MTRSPPPFCLFSFCDRREDRVPPLSPIEGPRDLRWPSVPLAVDFTPKCLTCLSLSGRKPSLPLLFSPREAELPPQTPTRRYDPIRRFCFVGNSFFPSAIPLYSRVAARPFVIPNKTSQMSHAIPTFFSAERTLPPFVDPHEYESFLPRRKGFLQDGMVSDSLI